MSVQDGPQNSLHARMDSQHRSWPQCQPALPFRHGLQVHSRGLGCQVGCIPNNLRFLKPSDVTKFDQRGMGKSDMEPGGK